MTRTVPGSGAQIIPIFNSVSGVRDVYVINGGEGYDPNDPPRLRIENCGTPIRDAVLRAVIEGEAGVITAVEVLDPGEGYDPLRIKINTSGNGYGAAAKAILWNEDQYAPDGSLTAPAGSLQYIQMLSNGDQYFSDATTAEINGGGGAGADRRKCRS